MPATRRPRTQPDEDEPLLTLKEAADRLGYASESLRQLMFRESSRPRPPLTKVRNRWRAPRGELDTWAAEQGIPVRATGRRAS